MVAKSYSKGHASWQCRVNNWVQARQHHHTVNAVSLSFVVFMSIETNLQICVDLYPCGKLDYSSQLCSPSLLCYYAAKLMSCAFAVPSTREDRML